MMAESAKFKCCLRENFEEKVDASFLVKFSNGHWIPSAPSKLKCTLYQKVKDRSQKRRLLMAETNGMSFLGSNFDPESSLGTSGTRYCIGELDHDQNTITLHKTQLVTLKPFIPGETEPEVCDVDPAATPAKSKVLIDQMVTTFGSEKQKRAFSAAKKNRVESKALEQALATAVTHAQIEVNKTETDLPPKSDLMPVYNPLAKVPQDVYNLEDIFSTSTIVSLKKVSVAFKKADESELQEWKSEGRYPEYVLDHIDKLPLAEPARSLKAAILFGLCCLIRMHNIPLRDFRRTGLRLEGIELPANFSEELLQKFAERQETKTGKIVHSLSARTKDKICLHLCVLTLILDDFKVDCSSLQRDLKLPSSKIMDYFRALGCSVSKKAVKRKAPDDDGSADVQATSSCTAELTIPLNFPKPKAKRRSRN